MATGAAVGIGAGMAAAGLATAVGGMKVSGTAPKFSPYQYGGDTFAAEEYRKRYAQQAAGGARLADLGVAGYAPLYTSGAAAQQQGQQTLSTALNNGFGNQGGVDLSGYNPAAAAQLQSAATLDQSARRTNAIARTGGAAGLRQALNANAGAGVQAARDAGMMRIAGERDLVGAQLQNQAAINQTRFGLAGLGMQQQQFGASAQGEAAGAVMQLGANREQMYNSQLSAFEDRQLQAQMAYEQARQQARLDKRRMIVGLGAGLIGAGGNVMAAGATPAPVTNNYAAAPAK